MLRSRENKLLIAFLAVCFFVACFGEWHSSVYSPHNQAISPGNNSTQTHTAELTIPKSAEDRIADYTWWLGAFTCALVVVSAVQIFFLTRADKNASRSADALRRQAEAFIVTESPAFQFAGFKIIEYLSVEPLTPGRDPVKGRPTPEFLRALIAPTNIGKGTLRILSTCIEYRIDKSLPFEPFYHSIGGVNIALKQDELGPWLIGEPIFSIDKNQRYGIDGGDTFLWIYGFISYLGLFKEVRNLGFVTRWEPVSGNFIPDGPPTYTYDREAK